MRNRINYVNKYAVIGGLKGLAIGGTFGTILAGIGTYINYNDDVEDEYNRRCHFTEACNVVNYTNGYPSGYGYDQYQAATDYANGRIGIHMANASKFTVSFFGCLGILIGAIYGISTQSPIFSHELETRLSATGLSDENIPEQYKDPITNILMDNPTRVDSGRIYDQSTLARLPRKVCPFTTTPITSEVLDEKLQKEIAQFVEAKEEQANEKSKEEKMEARISMARSGYSMFDHKEPDTSEIELVERHHTIILNSAVEVTENEKMLRI